MVDDLRFLGRHWGLCM